MNELMNRCIFAAGTVALALGVSACAAPGNSGSAAASGSSVNTRDMGQMSSQQTPQGETGTPHTMGGSAAPPVTRRTEPK